MVLSEIKKMKFKITVTSVFYTWGRYFDKVKYVENCL